MADNYCASQARHEGLRASVLATVERLFEALEEAAKELPPLETRIAAAEERCAKAEAAAPALAEAESRLASLTEAIAASQARLQELEAAITSAETRSAAATQHLAQLRQHLAA
jgi:chromosome segregation ATPase